MRLSVLPFAVLLLLACAQREVVVRPAAAPSAEGSLAQWNGNHPGAARALCVWAGHHAAASRLLFDWDASHPERSHELVGWAVQHPGANVNDFIGTHPNWPGFDSLANQHRPAVRTFLRWARNHPVAAQELMNHRAGLAWAGAHLSC